MNPDNDSEADEDLFWDPPEENTETDMSGTNVVSGKYESKSESIWDSELFSTDCIFNIQTIYIY